MNKFDAINIFKLSKPLATRLRVENFTMPITEYESAVLLKLVEVQDSCYWDDVWVHRAAGINGADLAALKVRLEYHYKRAEQLGGG